MNTNLRAFDLLQKVRRQSPVVHHLTNWVTIYDCAQIVKTLGASPVMAHAPEEVADMARIASALVLNIGTLTVDFVEAMKTAAASANQKGIPVILDVCGAGATELRDRKASELLDQVTINIIKGNASEIARVSGANVRTKGVDATEVATDLEALAQTLAVRRHATVVITGKVDIVAGDQGIYRVKNGDALMTRVVARVAWPLPSSAPSPPWIRITPRLRRAPWRVTGLPRNSPRNNRAVPRRSKTRCLTASTASTSQPLKGCNASKQKRVLLHKSSVLPSRFSTARRIAATRTAAPFLKDTTARLDAVFLDFGGTWVSTARRVVAVR